MQQNLNNLLSGLYTFFIVLVLICVVLCCIWTSTPKHKDFVIKWIKPTAEPNIDPGFPHTLSHSPHSAGRHQR